MKTVVLITVALMVMMCVTPVWCQGRPGPGGPGHCGPMPGVGMAVPPPPPAAAIEGITNALQLTADQAASLKTILTASETTIQPLMKAAAEASKALHEAVFATEYDAAAVAELAASALTAEGNLVTANIGAWAKIRPILTADQLAMLQAGPGPEHGPGGPPPPGQRR
ncbi:MAG: periplasmic heavy metal sensor [Armatimonadota bacterium]